MSAQELSAGKHPAVVLIADDHLFVRESLNRLFRRKWPDVKLRGAATYHELNEQIEQAEPDLIIMDYVMPGGTGCAAICSVVHLHPNARIVVFSGAISSVEAAQALHVGASAYLSKEEGLESLNKTVDLVLLGGSVAPKKVVDDLITSFNINTAPCKKAQSKQPELLEREKLLLDAIVKGTPNKLIAAELDISESTVKQIARGLFKKLGVANRTQAAVAAIESEVTFPVVEKALGGDFIDCNECSVECPIHQKAVLAT